MSTYVLALLLIIGVVIAAALVLFLPLQRDRTASRAPAGSQRPGPIYRDDNRYWLGGIFYNNPDDPDLVVPKRFGLGFTLNLGHPVGLLFIIGMLLLPILLTILGAFFPALHMPIGCHPSGCYPLP